MKKIMAILLATVVCCACFAGCKNDKEEETTTSKSTTTETTEETTTETTEDDPEGIDFDFEETFIDTFTDEENSNLVKFKDTMSKNYILSITSHIESENQSTVTPTSMIKKDDKYCFKAPTNGVQVTVLFDSSNTVVTCNDTSKTIQKVTDESTKEQLLTIFTCSNLLEYIESANVEINDCKYIKEEYDIMGYPVYYYYTPEGEYVFNYSDVEGTKTLNIITEFSQEVSDDYFIIPEDYEEIITESAE